jgi:hypothetical protein
MAPCVTYGAQGEAKKYIFYNRIDVNAARRTSGDQVRRRCNSAGCRLLGRLSRSLTSQQRSINDRRGSSLIAIGNETVCDLTDILNQRDRDYCTAAR